MLYRIRRDPTYFCCNIRRLEQNKVMTVLNMTLNTAAQLCSCTSWAFWMCCSFDLQAAHGSYYSKTNAKAWCPRAFPTYRMFTEFPTVEAVHCVTFITKAAPQAWKALFSFREHAGSSIHTLELVRKVSNCFLQMWT